MLIPKSCVSNAVELVAFTVKVKSAGTVGVPEMTPAVLNVKPSGSAPLETVHEQEEQLEAVSVSL